MSEKSGAGRDLAEAVQELSGTLALLPIDLLKPHEGVREELVEELAEEIRRDGRLRKAILVDRRTLVILDGHHRVMALRRLGCRRAPCLLIDYSSERIDVSGWGGGEPISKSAVLVAGLRGELMPPKTTKHTIKFDRECLHASVIEPDVDIPLEALL